MKRGRPTDEYPSEEFRRRASEKIRTLNLTVRQVEGRSGVNRGTISQILRGLRHGAPEDRYAIMIALEFDAEEHRTFLPYRQVRVPDLVLYDPSYPLSGSYLPIQRGRELLMRSLFPEARCQLGDAFNSALARRDCVRAADAAEVMAWLELELMDRGNMRALQWANASIGLAEKHIGAGLAQILKSIEHGSRSAELSPEDEITRTLAKVLHIRAKLFAERISYYAEPTRRRNADAAFRENLTVDGYLQSGQFGHDFRWQARLLAGDRTGREAAEHRIQEGRDHFERGSSGEALVARDLGFVYWQTGQPAQARAAMLKAIDLLAAHADARALGPAFYVLSKVAGEGDRLHEARRFALTAAAFHPFGYVLENAAAHVQTSDRRMVERDKGDLLGGRPPFQIVHQVFARLANGRDGTSVELIGRNLSRAFVSRLSL